VNRPEYGIPIQGTKLCSTRTAGLNFSKRETPDPDSAETYDDPVEKPGLIPPENKSLRLCERDLPRLTLGLPRPLPLHIPYTPQFYTAPSRSTSTPKSLPFVPWFLWDILLCSSQECDLIDRTQGLFAKFLAQNDTDKNASFPFWHSRSRSLLRLYGPTSAQRVSS